jgi:cell division protein FtsB
MSEIKLKNKNPFWHSPLFLLFLLFVFVFFAYNLFFLIVKERNTRKSKDMVQDKLSAMQKREDFLIDEIRHIKTEKGTEELIREKYRVVRPGEKMLVIVNKEEEVTDLDENPDRLSFFGWIKGWFKKSE